MLEFLKLNNKKNRKLEKTDEPVEGQYQDMSAREYNQKKYIENLYNLKKIAYKFQNYPNYNKLLNLYVLYGANDAIQSPIFLLTDKTIYEYFDNKTDEEIKELYPTIEEQLDVLKEKIIVELINAYEDRFRGDQYQYFAVATNINRYESVNDEEGNEIEKITISDEKYCQYSKSLHCFYPIKNEALPAFIIRIPTNQGIYSDNELDEELEENDINIELICQEFYERFNCFYTNFNVQEPEDIVFEQTATKKFYFPKALPIYKDELEENYIAVGSKLYSMTEEEFINYFDVDSLIDSYITAEPIKAKDPLSNDFKNKMQQIQLRVYKVSETLISDYSTINNLIQPSYQEYKKYQENIEITNRVMELHHRVILNFFNEREMVNKSNSILNKVMKTYSKTQEYYNVECFNRGLYLYKISRNELEPIYLLTYKSIKEYFDYKKDDEILKQFPTEEKQKNYLKRQIFNEIIQAYDETFYGNAELELLTITDYINNYLTYKDNQMKRLENNQKPLFFIKIPKLMYSEDFEQTTEMYRHATRNFFVILNKFLNVWVLNQENKFSSNEKINEFYPQLLPILSNDYYEHKELVKSYLLKQTEEPEDDIIKDILNDFSLDIYQG